MTYLLDANVLIALAIRGHVHHESAVDWLAQAGEVATSPVVEGALVRFLIRAGESGETAREVVRRFHAAPGATFWPDRLSYGELDLSRVTGHRQVTDAYLVRLAQGHSGVLATFDEALTRVWPTETLLVPHE